MLAWAKSQSGNRAELRSLRCLTQKVGAELGAESTALERHLYGTAAGAWHGQSLWHAFQRQPQTIVEKSPAPPPLPALFKLGAG